MPRAASGRSSLLDVADRPSAATEPTRAAPKQQGATADRVFSANAPLSLSHNTPPILPSRGGIDPDLMRINDAWPTLSTRIREAILAVLEAVKGSRAT
jgi:hypothetical protein